MDALRYLSGAGPFADRSRHPLPTHVLMDLKLPEKSGFEVLEWIRNGTALRTCRWRS
jgi:CheY-like chemotaxis protein